jgi:hypothetical protein
LIGIDRDDIPRGRQCQWAQIRHAAGFCHCAGTVQLTGDVELGETTLSVIVHDDPLTGECVYRRDHAELPGALATTAEASHHLTVTCNDDFGDTGVGDGQITGRQKGCSNDSIEFGAVPLSELELAS